MRCTILLLLDYQPLQFKLDPRLARLLGVHTQTRPVIIQALWQYIKTHKLQVGWINSGTLLYKIFIIGCYWINCKYSYFQDSHEREFINCDKYLEQIFSCPRMKFAEIPQRLNPLLHPPDPIVINHIIRYNKLLLSWCILLVWFILYLTHFTDLLLQCGGCGAEADCMLRYWCGSRWYFENTNEQLPTLNNKSAGNTGLSFIYSFYLLIFVSAFWMFLNACQLWFQNLDNKIHETVESINTLKTNREFFLSFAKDPQQFINKWLISQTRDLKVISFLLFSSTLKLLKPLPNTDNIFSFLYSRPWRMLLETQRKSVDLSSSISHGLRRLCAATFTPRCSRSVLNWNRLWGFVITDKITLHKAALSAPIFYCIFILFTYSPGSVCDNFYCRLYLCMLYVKQYSTVPLHSFRLPEMHI